MYFRKINIKHFSKMQVGKKIKPSSPSRAISSNSVSLTSPAMSVETRRIIKITYIYYYVFSCKRITIMLSMLKINLDKKIHW